MNPPDSRPQSAHPTENPDGLRRPDSEKPFSRRRFLVRSALAGSALPFLSARSWGNVLGANGDLRVAVVGIRSRGWAHVKGFERLAGVRVVALCDVDASILGRQAGAFEKEFGRRPEVAADLRTLLDREDIDVISIATPNHWHALQSIWSIQSGKDVYVEKPVSHNVWEGRQIVRAARKYGRIVQAGTQARSSHGLREAFRFVQDGGLGKLKLARGLCYKPRQSIGKVAAPQKVPNSVDYDLWLGPAPAVPLRRRRLHYDWHWDFDTGNGDLGNQGIHQMDLCRWAVRESELAPRVLSIGGRLGVDDDGNTPNTQFIYHDYDRVPVLFEVRGLPKDRASQAEWSKNMDRYHGVGIGVVLHCEEGELIVPSYNSAFAVDGDGKRLKEFQGSTNHFENFVDAVRKRDAGILRGDILEGHLSSALCHVGNVSHQVGVAAQPEALRSAVRTVPESKETLDRMVGHLEANSIDLEQSPLTLGAWLRVDPKNERFVGHDAANARLSRPYREPFVVPSVV
ncbi:MAG: Gfo/Idh/MocA family oxidoreductase [Planctomycetota bacterium]